MESEVAKKMRCRTRRADRVRSKVRGNAEKPRLSVIKSNTNIYAQLIDDEAGVTIASASTLSDEFKSKKRSRRNKSSAKKIGGMIASLAKEKNVTGVVFDRGPFKFHGVMAAVAEGAKEGGLTI